MMQRRLIVAVLLVTACSKNDTKTSGDAASTRAAAPSVAAVEPAPSAAASASSTHQNEWFIGSWRGDITVARHPSATSTKEGGPGAWEKDGGQKFSGPAKVEVSLDQFGDAAGTVTGALGELGLRGKLDGDALRVTIVSRSNDPSTIQNGYLLLKHEGEQLKGQLRAASGDALAMRQADVALTKASP